MKKLFLHIGLGKTGSSALQSWLSLNSNALSKRGVDYADLVPHAKTGEVSSGNGYDLQLALIDQDFDEVERLLTTTYFFNPKNNVALISCELFQGIRAPFVQKIHEICAKCDIDVTVIVYIRSVYEQQYSTYLQGIKRSSISHRFGEKSSDIAFHRSVEYLRRYLRVFGENVIAVNYDIAKKDIYASMAGIIGVETTGLKKLEKKVNRSLTLEETEVLRRMNGLHGGIFATNLSDFIIKASPDIDTPIVYDRDLLERVRDATEEDLLWVNDQFKIPTPVASDNYDGHSSAEPPVLTRESYQPVVQWAVEFKPTATVRVEFADFLEQLVDFIKEFALDDAKSVKRKLKRVQTELAKEVKVREPKEASADTPQNKTAASKSKTPTHIITYCFGSETISEEVDQQMQARFSDWLSMFHKYSVGSTINAVENTTLVSRDAATPVSKDLALTGFTLVDIDDTDTLLSLVDHCPLLEIGGVVEVSRAVNNLDV